MKKETHSGIGAVMHQTVCAHCRGELEQVGDSFYHRARSSDHKPAPTRRAVLIARYPSFDAEISRAA